MNLSGRGRRPRSSANGALLSVLIAIAVTSLAACSSGDRNDRRADPGTSPAAPKTTAATPDAATPADGDPILVKTSINGLAGKGKVVTGSVLGESAFCAHGTVRHEQGSPEIGFPAVNVFLCSEGQLKIGFGPGPEQMNNSVQTSDWKILDGRGRFMGMTGSGQMIVQWSKKAGSDKGHETFTGRVLTP